MIKLYRLYQKYGDSAKMVVQIYDDLICIVKDELLAEVIPQKEAIMKEDPLPNWQTKLRVETNVGKNLAEMHLWEPK